jgi:CheY-like chemotaxis protein
LLVDDEQLIIDVGVQLLERLGYSVIPAHSGREAVALFRKHRRDIDIVILDMIMPDMSGKQTFNELVALQPDVRVILSSGYSLDGEASQILQRGCVAFIQKPYTMENLARQLQTTLKMERTRL